MAAIIASYAVRLMMRLVRASQALRFLRAACAEAFLGRLYVYDSSFVCMTGRLLLESHGSGRPFKAVLPYRDA